MSAASPTQPVADGLRLIAFYLPQFHPIPENDAWWGRGFTEWRNVVRARPLYTGHYQPQIPGELGFYDLRVPEVREAQAALADAHGIAGFCYYHYWFNGRRVLERPFDEVLASGNPDFPFCLCWANEPWTRNWDGGARDVLIPQRYSDEDDQAHIAWLVKAFRDERYIRVRGRPVMMIYNAGALPDSRRTTELWRRQSIAAGTGDPYLIKFTTFGDEDDPQSGGFDASSEFLPHGVAETLAAARFNNRPDTRKLGNAVWQYAEVVAAQLARPLPSWTRYQCVVTGWDNSPRKPDGSAVMFLNATPAEYERWLRGAVSKARTAGHEFVFINAWNEWAESAHLEPDLRYGRAFLEATARAAGVDPASRAITRLRDTVDARELVTTDATTSVDYHDLYVQHRSSSAREAEGMLRRIQELEDVLAGRASETDSEPDSAPTAASDPHPTSLVGRLVRTAKILRRDWKLL
jgi:lipopolysaccharide biosynthesis protein